MSSKGNRQKVSFPDVLLNRVQDECERSGLSFAEVVRRAVCDWLTFRDIRLAGLKDAPAPALAPAPEPEPGPGPGPGRHTRNKRKRRPTGPVSRPEGWQAPASTDEQETGSSVFDELDFDETDSGQGQSSVDPFAYTPPPGVMYVRAEGDPLPVADVDSDLFERLGK